MSERADMEEGDPDREYMRLAHMEHAELVEECLRDQALLRHLLTAHRGCAPGACSWGERAVKRRRELGAA